MSFDLPPYSTLADSFWIELVKTGGKRGGRDAGCCRLKKKKIMVFKAFRASLVTQMVKNPPAMWETSVRSLGWEDLLEKGMATHSSILAWRILWTEEPGGL